MSYCKIHGARGSEAAKYMGCMGMSYCKIHGMRVNELLQNFASSAHFLSTNGIETSIEKCPEVAISRVLSRAAITLKSMNASADVEACPSCTTQVPSCCSF